MSIALTAPQRILVEFARSRIGSLEFDTSNFDDQAMIIHLAVVMEIIKSRGMGGGLYQALFELGDKFFDLGALAGEMMAAADGARH
jgi:hypothetical protein